MPGERGLAGSRRAQINPNAPLRQCEHQPAAPKIPALLLNPSLPVAALLV